MFYNYSLSTGVLTLNGNWYVKAVTVQLVIGRPQHTQKLP